jgi:hypothetical protein
MGENIMLNQVKQFKKGRDRSLEQMSVPTLFDRPDIVTTIYTAVPTSVGEVRIGQRLLGYVSADGNRINLADGNRVMAIIEGDGARDLISALRGANSPGVTEMNVESVSQISGFLKTTIAKPRDEK